MGGGFITTTVAALAPVFQGNSICGGERKGEKREQGAASPRGAPVTFSYNSPLWRLSCLRGTK